MNYLYLIAFLIVLYFIWDKYEKNNLSLINNGIQSNYNGTNTKKNSTNIGFVKPEHKLFKILNSISGGNKVKLSGTCSKFIYNKNTISSELNEKLTFLIQDIISSLNRIAKNEYYMKQIENVYCMIDSKNNQRYIIDYFIYDIQNFYTIRLISDIVIVDDEIYINYLHVQSGSNNTLLNKYDIKFNSIGILFDSNMFQEDIYFFYRVV